MSEGPTTEKLGLAYLAGAIGELSKRQEELAKRVEFVVAAVNELLHEAGIQDIPAPGAAKPTGDPVSSPKLPPSMARRLSTS